MSKLEKLLNAMRSNPQDWKIEDIDRVVEHYGFKKRTTSGSHVTYSHDKLVQIITIPARKPIKPVYIKKLLKLIDEVLK